MTQYITVVQERPLIQIQFRCRESIHRNVPAKESTTNTAIQLRQYHRRYYHGFPAMAEGEGFEPPRLSPNCFQDSRYSPLSHPSRRTVLNQLLSLFYTIS